MVNHNNFRVQQVVRVSRIEAQHSPWTKTHAMTEMCKRFADTVTARHVTTTDCGEFVEYRIDLVVMTPEQFYGAVNAEAMRIAHQLLSANTKQEGE